MKLTALDLKPTMEAHQHTDLEPIHPGAGRQGLLKRIGSALAASAS